MEQMTLDKAINHKKEHRKQYHGSKAVDKSCRNHGGCPYCEENRRHKNDKRKEAQDDRVNEYEKEGDAD